MDTTYWYITALPREILQYIFGFIPPNDLATCASHVSKLFNELAEDPFFWKHKCVREYYVGITGNVYPNSVNWKREYLFLKSSRDILINNTMVLDPKYEQMADMASDGTHIFFENVRQRDGTNPAPITVQSSLPIRPLPFGDFSVGYYEIKLLDAGEEQMIGLGLARNGYVDAMPGWKKGSIGYHGDDGRVFNGCGYGRALTENWAEFEVFGCGVDFRRKRVFFTKNGYLLATYPLPRADGLHATLGSRTEGETVSINFGKQKFEFDVIKYQMEISAKSPALSGQLAVPYSKLVYTSRLTSHPLSLSLVPYDSEDDVEDEDNEFDDKGMNKAAQYFNSVLRVLMNHADYPDDDGSVENLVTVLRNQMQEGGGGLALPAGLAMPELRAALSNQLQFSKQSALLGYFVNAYQSAPPSGGIKPTTTTTTVPPTPTPTPTATLPTTSLGDNFLRTDEFPKNEIIKCIATLLIEDYRDDHPLVLNTINRGRSLFNFQPPPDMTLTQERGQLSLILSREIQANERARRAKRRDLFRRLRAKEPTFYYYNAKRSSNNMTTSNLQNSIKGNNDVDEGDYEDEDDMMTNANMQANFQILFNEIINTPAENEGNAESVGNAENEGNENENENGNENENEDEANRSAVVEESPTLSPQQFQEMLKSYMDILQDRTIPDEDSRIAGAICQWYTTLDIDLKPEMHISVERNRLLKVLNHLRVKAEEHIEDLNATSFISRTSLRFKRYCRNLFKKEHNTMKLSLFVVIGFLVARSVQRRTP